ncbi:MAG: glycosyltransferase family 2 protein [Alphaproteobacteria bacterium]|nr:glycosyltransferase family 2 protein [Alphaproteobacteria bacterium]
MTPPEPPDDGMISVIIPSYNARAFIAECLTHILATGYRPMEIIVVDDASTDDSPTIVETFVRDHPDVVRLLRLPDNGGPARARNAGARAAKGRYLFFCDADTRLARNALDLFIRRIPEADAVCGHYDWRPTNSGPVAWYKALFNYQMWSNRGVFAHDVFNAAVAGIRAEAFHAAGGYDESLRWGMDYENEEFGHRLARTHRILVDPAIVAGHWMPGFVKLTRTYFLRVSLWMLLFMRRRKFEAGGPASAGSGVASLAVPAGLASVLGALAAPAPLAYGAAAAAVACAGLYLRGYGGFLLFTLRRKPAFLPVALVLNLYFSSVIAAAAAWGALRYLGGADGEA